MVAIKTLLLAACSALGALAATKKHDASFTPDYVLEATLQNITISCKSRMSVVINGTSPGPKITLRENQTTWIRVWNRMPHDNFTIHWHGLSQRTAPFSDGTPLVSQWPIPSNRFFDYEIRPEIGDAGTYFYHSHVGFQQSTAHGVLIVQDVKQPQYQYDGDVPLIFGDYYPKDDDAIVSGLLGSVFKWSGEPSNVVVNGQSGNCSSLAAVNRTCAPHIINVEPGKKYRLRTIGATAISFVQMGIEGHNNLTVIEADGQYTKPASIDYIQVAPGQRYSYILQAKSLAQIQKSKKTDYWIRYETRERPVSVTGYALLRYNIPGKGPKAPLPQLPTTSPVQLPNTTYNYLEYTLQSKSQANNKAFPRLSEVTRTVTIQMAQVLRSGSYVNGTPNGTLEWGQNTHTWKENQVADTNVKPYLVNIFTGGGAPDYNAAVNNQGLDPKTGVYPAKVGEVLEIVWVSNSGPSGGFDFHPMHVHGEHVWDIGSGNGTYDAKANEARLGGFVPAKRDTTVLYRYLTKGVPNQTLGWRAWRIRITEDNVGAWMMHCHIAQHAVMGMNTIWVFGDQKNILTKFPNLPYISGYLDYSGDAVGSDSKAPVVNHHFEGGDGSGQPPK